MGLLQYYYVWLEIGDYKWSDVVTNLWYDSNNSSYYGMLKKRRATQEEITNKINYDILKMELKELK